MTINIENDEPLKGMKNKYVAMWDTPDDCYYEIRVGEVTARFGSAMYERILAHPVLIEECKKYDHITINEFVKLSEAQLAYLIFESGAKIICNSDHPKKQHKPKHNIPYWANDWRKK